jgi:hypothetical protein
MYPVKRVAAGGADESFDAELAGLVGVVTDEIGGREFAWAVGGVEPR